MKAYCSCSIYCKPKLLVHGVGEFLPVLLHLNSEQVTKAIDCFRPRPILKQLWMNCFIFLEIDSEFGTLIKLMLEKCSVNILNEFGLHSDYYAYFLSIK